jgi:hypothetical protein
MLSQLTFNQKKVYDEITNYFKLSNDSNIRAKETDKKNKEEIKNEFLLVGYAGTGKTTLVTKLILDLIKDKKCKNIAIAAPTHKAVNIAKSKLFNNMDEHETLSKNIKIMTIHRLLNYKSVINSEGEKVFEKSKIDPAWYIYDLIVIDECSMLSDQIIDDIDSILRDKKNKNVKIMYVGDPAQLPPVNQRRSIIFDKEIKKNILDQIIRTKNSLIMELCNEHRNWIMEPIDKNIPNIIKYIHKEVKGFRSRDYEVWLNHYIMNFEKNKNDHNNSIILTWTNNKCKEYNDYVRKALFKKDDLNFFEKGEILIFNDFHRIEEDEEIENDKGELVMDKKYISFYTSEQVKIKKIKKQVYNFNKIKVTVSNTISSDMNIYIAKKVKEMNVLLEEDIEVFNLKINKMSETKENKNPKKYLIYSIHPDSQEKYKNILSKIEVIMMDIKENTIKKIEKDKKLSNIKKCSAICEIEKKVNKIYLGVQSNVIDCFANLNYGYCITVHKSQGSTFEDVYIDLGDILKNKNEEEAMKCIYTSLTRTSKTLQLLLNV